MTSLNILIFLCASLLLLENACAQSKTTSSSINITFQIESKNNQNIDLHKKQMKIKNNQTTCIKAKVTKCVCKKGFTNISSKCVLDCERFNAKANKQNNSCVCKDSYTGQFPNCKINCEMINNSEPNQLGLECVCKQNYIFNSNKTQCQKIIYQKNCSSIKNSELINQNCLCKSGYSNITNKCIINCSHIYRSYPSQDGNQCLCAQGYFINQQKDKCIINCSKIQNSQPNDLNQKCICLQGFIEVNNHCIKDCSQLLYSHPDETNSKCDCNYGYVFCQQMKKCIKFS